MVLGNLKDVKNYYSLNPLFEKAIDFLSENMDALPGRYEIQGEDCFMMIVETEKRDKSQCRLEVHNTYIDIQVILSGSEGFGYKSRENCLASSGDFDSDKDIGFFSDTPTTYVEAVKGDFVIFFPHDGHAPLVGEGSVRKAIIKIRA